MLNLAKVLCLLLVVEATSAWQTASDMIRTAEKTCSYVITLSLDEIKTHHVRNVQCVRAEILRIELETQHVHPELRPHAQREKFNRRVNEVMLAIGTYTKWMTENIDTLDKIYETESAVLNKKQLLADACASSYSNKWFGRMRTVECIDEVRLSVLSRTKTVKSYFERMCNDARKMSKSALSKLRVLMSSQ